MSVHGRLQDRLGLLLGLALTAVVAAWWLAGTRLALDYGTSPAGPASLALAALVLLRAMVMAPLALRTAALRGFRQGLVAAFALVAVPWPLVLLAASASADPATRIVLAEAGLLLGAVLLPLAGRGLRRLLPRPQWAALAGSLLGVALAAAAWTWRPAWAALLPWVGP